MVSKRESHLCSKLVRIIRERGDIHRWDLIDEAHISIRDYNMIKSYLEHKFDHYIKYDKPTQMWVNISKPTDKLTELANLETFK